ncbi:MAG: ABC transporter substrate-binding protein [Candidatus Latescibacteria bacterium]|nr:ABC transporter substrate-binding protein [Candidatus Latescibacterota bacterium]
MQTILILFALATLGCGGHENGLEPIPRNRTLIMDCAESNTCGGQIQDYNAFNPYLPGATSRIGYNFLYEPLYFYNAFREQNNLIPWIAEGHQFNADFTEVVIKIRHDVTWSDDEPWTARDLVFTINMLKDNAPELTYSTDMKTWVKEAVALDDWTARITLTAPNPRFVYSYFTANFGIGVPIVPRHIWEGQNPQTFANFDMQKEWPVVSGPYRLALSTPGQRIWDRRDYWWASQSGFHPMPQVERLIFLPYMDESKRVQNLLTDQLDTCLDLRPPNIKTAVEGNPRLTTWSGRQPPYGYLDFWPVSLGFNDLEEPFSDPQVRWAINFAIDRQQLVEVGWQGSGSPTLLPFPDFPPMHQYTDQIQDLLAKYPVGLHDLARSAQLMEERGWKKVDGFWTRKGERVRIIIDIYPGFQDLAPVLVEQLRRGGFDADFRATSDVYNRMAQGEAKAFMDGHGGSVSDPYLTLSFYHSRFVQPTGTPAEHFWRWKDAQFDQLVDRMSQVDPQAPETQVLFRQALEIWLRELPAIPLVQWYHRIPHNQTYWTNWPSAVNPYIHTAYWHRTFLLVLLGLKPTH